MSKNKRGKTATTTPFFARYLEGQVSSNEPGATITGGKGIAYAKAATKSIPQTLKYPSDRDEWDYAPLYRKAADVPEKLRDRIVTLKYPSDRDEDIYEASYLSAADVPSGKPKLTGKVKLKKKKKK